MLYDEMRLGIRRGIDPGMAGLVRLDRAIIYLRRKLERLILEIKERDTKSLGDTYYSVQRFASDVAQLAHMGGDTNLTEELRAHLKSVHSRTIRFEAIRALQNFRGYLDAYELTGTNREMFSSEETIGPEREADPLLEKKVTDVSSPNAVFVIMPFSTDFLDVWKGGIERAVIGTGHSPVRVDMINRSSNINDDIVESIVKCKLAIVDVTGNNPNVMFELGYTLAKKKTNIIISQSTEFLPFDIRNIRTIVYKNSWTGIEELNGKLQAFLKEVSPIHARARSKTASNQTTKKK